MKVMKANVYLMEFKATFFAIEQFHGSEFYWERKS